MAEYSPDDCTAPKKLSGNSMDFFEILDTTHSYSKMTRSMKKLYSVFVGLYELLA